MINNSNSLVSIVVVTYNSSEYVLETLESAKQQTYQNIELIVTDDCSTDNTVAICSEWLGHNKERFVRTKLVESVSNTGIPANGNRGRKNAQGVFIKGIAGDDILLPNCIEDLVDGIGDNSIITGICQPFYVDNNGEKRLRSQAPTPNNYSIFDSSSQLQHKRLLTVSFIPAPAVLLRKEVWEKVGFYDERYPYMEDLPFYLKCTSEGFKITLLPKTVVLYRTKHDSMIFRKTEFYNKKFQNCRTQFKKEYIYSQVPWYNIVFWETELMKRTSYFIIGNICNNRKNLLTKAIDKFFYFLSLLPYSCKIREYWYRIHK